MLWLSEELGGIPFDAADDNSHAFRCRCSVRTAVVSSVRGILLRHRVVPALALEMMITGSSLVDEEFFAGRHRGGGGVKPLQYYERRVSEESQDIAVYAAIHLPNLLLLLYIQYVVRGGTLRLQIQYQNTRWPQVTTTAIPTLPPLQPSTPDPVC
jgi:hypothetical protein